MGCYIATRDASTIEGVAASIRDRYYEDKLLVSVNLNANLVDPEGTPQGEAIADELDSVGLIYMRLHFLPRRKPWLQDRCTWNMRRDGQEV